MKKLLSICFLSILLGLLSFSTRAQSSGGSNCASGFWIQNLQPDTISGLVNLPADMPNTGKLPLSHTLGSAYYSTTTGVYLGNAHPQVTELYELHFCNTCGLDPKTKVSVDWLLYRDGQLVNDNLSDYVEFGIYTLYSKLNQYGQCQSIQWLGGTVNNGFGYCTQVPGSYSLYDTIHGLNGPCNDPTNYPGAMHVEQGTPMAVLTQLGEIVPAQGLTSIYSESLDYFYLDFFQQTRTIVQIKWKQVGNYKLVMRIRERVGGTPWNNLTWNENETTDFIGGHQSCCGQVIAEDSIAFPYLGEFSKEVCEQEHYIFGRPEYDFHVTMPDTNVVFGQYVFDNTDCRYFQTDSIYRFHFFVRNTPEVVVLKQKDTLCKCSSFGPEQLLSMIKYDTVDLQYASDHKFLWYYWGANGYGWYEQMPDIDTVVGTYTFVVRQVNTYTNFNQFYSTELDTVVCAGDPVTLYVTFLEMDPPVVPAPANICLEVIDSAFIHSVTAEHDARCANTTRWYKTVSTSFHNNKTEYLSDLVYTGDEFPIHLIDYAPATNIDKTVKFYAVSYDQTRNCESKYFTTYTIYIHQTPELKKVTIPDMVNCPGAEVTMSVKINNSPDQTETPYTYKWNNDLTEVNLKAVGATTYTRVPFVADTVYTVNKPVNNSVSQIASFPLSNEVKYNYTQQIYTASEIGGAGVITKIAFEKNIATAFNKNNVKIYLGTTTTSSFNNSNKQWITGGTLVYDGPLTLNGSGWQEIELQNGFTYDGTSNLVVTFDDQSGTKSNSVIYFKPNTKSNACMRSYGDNPITASSTKTVASTRNNIKFFAEGAGFTTNDKNQTAYNVLDPNDSCGTSYLTTVYVIDGNGCKSAPVEFTYTMNDTIKPTVNHSTVTTNVYACHLDSVNAPVYTTVNALEAGAGVQFSDNCDHKFLHIVGVNSVLSSNSDTTCHEVLTRTYTVKDHCGNPVTFSQVFVSQDTTKPSFVFAPGEFPLIRLFPVEGGNCTFNSPDSMTFVNAVAPHVFDNCTDSAYLMSTLKFFWENTNESPINGVDIFKKKNHLSVVAQITDRCGNVFAQDIIFLDLPEHIAIKPNAITSSGNQCFGDTATLQFDVNYITDDTLIGPFVPYTYEWIEVNGRPVTFTAGNETTTNILFPGTGDYTFIMKVTDRNGCYAETEPIVINVRPLPKLVINHIVLNGQTEPYCPTYGNLTIRAEVVDAVPGQTVDPHAFVWTGESVNTMSDSARTWVTIVPEWCDTLYYPTVTVTDDRGCVGTVTDTIEVYSAGPQVNNLPDTVVEKMAGCVFRIPDFKPFIDASVVGDDCYTFSQLKYSDAFGTIERTDWYSQSPAAGTIFTEDSRVVTITIKNPCGKTGVAYVNVLKPTDVLTVSIDPADTAECQEFIENNGIVFTTTVENAVGTVDYEWTRDNNTTVLGHGANYTVLGTMEPGTYTYRVVIEDELGCQASNTADLTVYFQGADPVLRKFPNTLCERYNGALIVDVAPTGYEYDLQHNDYSFFHFHKISDNPDHQPTEWNTIAFDSLRPGWYTLTVTTNEGCDRTYQLEILNNSQAPNAPTFTKVDVTVCTNDNGQLTINALPGFTYEVYSVDATGAMTLVGTATSYNNLPVGTYYIEATQTSTHCKSSASVTLLDAAPRPEPTYTPTANNNCDNIAGIYNGKINITSSASWQYTVYSVNGTDTTYYLNDVTLTSSNNPITGLRQGTYYVTAYNPANGCSTINPIAWNVGYTPINTTITPKTTPNNFCVTDTANGKVSFTVLSNFIDYNLMQGADTIRKTADYTSTGWTSLYHGSYKIEATNKYFCHVTKTGINVAHETINPQVTATSTINPSCVKDLGTITLKVTNASDMNVTKYGNAHTASYKIEKGTFVWDSASTANQVTFTNVASGVYNYTVKTQYGCAKTGTVEVEQYQLPAMQLDSTPNHMCAPTFEKPGDGTVTVVVPTTETVPGAHFFMYYFYDANDVNMDVPYELPLTNTKYWLAAKRYHVVAKDTVTGCEVEGYITVEDSLYQVDFDFETTPNYACNTVDGNGSITVVNATSTNPDAVFAYSLDDVTYTMNPVFTYLKDSLYTVYVKDTVSACVKMKLIPVNPTDSCAPVITITDGTTTGHRFDYCFNTPDIQLCATAEDTCDNSTFSFAWLAPCAEPHESNTNCINVQTDHYVVNGCDYILSVKNDSTGCTYYDTAHVAIHPNPELAFRINGNIAKLTETNYFCENQDLHIEVFSVIGDAVLDTTTIEWTLGIIGTGFADFHVKGDTIASDDITYCVRANSKFGCPSPIASLPVSFKRLDYDTVTIKACDSCQIAQPDGSMLTVKKPASESYPYITTMDVIYTSVLKGCDSLVHYPIILISAPEITGTPTVTPFCEDENKTLADFEGFTVEWNDVQNPGNSKWIAADQTSEYVLVTNIADLTDGNYVLAYNEFAMANTTNATNDYINSATTVTTNPSDNIVWEVKKNGNSYTIRNSAVNKYVAWYYSGNTASLISNITNDSKWNITLASNGDATIRNAGTTGRMLQYNSSADMFRCYTSANQKAIRFYKEVQNNYVDVPSTTALTYEYVTTHDIKRVVWNDCDADSATLNLEVYKKPAVNEFNLNNPYCASQTYNFTATVSSYGTQATAKLYIEGNTTPLATTTFNGLNQTITFSNIKTPLAYNDKNLTIEVVNTNNFCDAVTMSKKIYVDTAEIKNLANNNKYCVNDEMTIADFTGITPANYTSVKLYKVNGSAPASGDPEITLPYTFTDRSMNGKQVYFIAANQCYNNIVSNTVTLTVNDKPDVPNISDVTTCASGFTLTKPNITWNGSYNAQADSGWLLKGSTGVYAKATQAQISAAATCPNTAEVAYFATGSCGSDTSFFTVQLMLPPTVSIAFGDQCPNLTVLAALTTNSLDNHCSSITSNIWKVKKVDNTGEKSIDPSTTTLASLLNDGYNDGKLMHIVTNSCGTTTATATINVLTNTFTAPTYQEACSGDTLGAFIATAPAWTGTASVVAPASAVAQKWQLKVGTTVTDATIHTVINASDNPEVEYMWVTQCNDTIHTGFTALTVNEKPELTLTTVAGVCAGSTIDPATAINTVTYHGNQSKYDTLYTVNGSAVTASTVYTAADNGKWLVVTLDDNGDACGVVKDSVQLTVYPLPTPTISGPEKVCSGVDFDVTAGPTTGITNYTFFENGTQVKTGTSNTYTANVTVPAGTPLGEVFPEYSVTVTDIHGCVGSTTNNATVKVTANPEFIFINVAGDTTHEYTTTTGVGLTYDWIIGTECFNPDTLVYVEYDIYYKDENETEYTLIPNAEIGQYLLTQNYQNVYGTIKPYVTTNTFSWLNGDGSQNSNTSYYNYAIANPNSATAGNHFPNSGLGLENTNVYDDLWLHFIGDRRVTKTFVPFRKHGEYKVVYRLYATSHADDFMHLYTEDNPDHDNYGAHDLYLGGQNAFMGTLSLLARDSVHIVVTGENLVTPPVTDITTPDIAPGLTVEEAQVAPDMEVWPNPAPAVTTTLKAVVHNMNGEANVTLTNLNGKQVYSGKTYIDNDNYYFEFSVNSLSVGSYILTVRTNEAVVTKKVIVTVLAR